MDSDSTAAGLGNAVPSLITEIIGLEIRRQLLGATARPTKPLELLPPRRASFGSRTEPLEAWRGSSSTGHTLASVVKGLDNANRSSRIFEVAAARVESCSSKDTSREGNARQASSYRARDCDAGRGGAVRGNLYRPTSAYVEPEIEPRGSKPRTHLGSSVAPDPCVSVARGKLDARLR